MITMRVVCFNCGAHDEGAPCARQIGNGIVVFDEHDFHIIQELKA